MNEDEMREKALRGMENASAPVPISRGIYVSCALLPGRSIGCSSLLAVIGAAITYFAHGPWWLLAAFALLFAFGFGGWLRSLIYAAVTGWITYRTWGTWWVAIPATLVLVAFLARRPLFDQRIRPGSRLAN